jgi:hypothetical protein
VSETKPRRWWDIFSHPLFGLASLVVGVVGISFGWYWFHETSNRPEIAWSALRQIVFDHRNATPDVTVLDAHGTKITDNLYASQITVWNSGNMRFDNVDAQTLIRKPLTFQLSGAGRIVSASITNAKKDTDGAWAVQMAPQVATMTWRHFDPDAAARILILYTGDDASDVSPEIVVAGYSVLKNVRDIRPINISSAVSRVLAGFFSMIISVLGMWTVIFKIRPYGYWRKIGFSLGSLSMTQVVLTIIFTANIIWWGWIMLGGSPNIPQF